MAKFKEPIAQDPFRDPVYRRLNTRASEDKVQHIVRRALEIWQSPTIHPSADEPLLSFRPHGASQTINTTLTTIRFEGDSTTHPDIAVTTEASLPFEGLIYGRIVRVSQFIFRPKLRFFGPPKKYEAGKVHESLSFQYDLAHGEFVEPVVPVATSQNTKDVDAVVAEHTPYTMDFSAEHGEFLHELIRRFNPELAFPLPDNIGKQAE